MLLKIYIILFCLFLVNVFIEIYFDINYHRYWYPKYYDPNYVLRNKSIVSPVGESIAADSSIVICSLIRNVESSFANTKKRLEMYGSLFKDYRIVLFENDSSDNTRRLADQWTHVNNRVILLSCPGVQDCKFNLKTQYQDGLSSNKRITRMKWARQQYLDFVKAHYANYDYMMVYDFDLDGNMCLDGFFQVLANSADWDAVFCNGRNPIPGTFGFKTFVYDGLPFVECDESFDYYITHRSKLDLWNGYLNMIKIAMKVDHSNKPFIRVRSAFNGVGLYKMSAIMHASYTDGPDFICEHTNLHYNMKSDRLYISKNWIGYFPLQGPKGNQIVNFF